jgi:glycosyltransferase involved in cell wall biosynthesis
VVITSFNYGRFLEEAVDSVLGQTFKDLEVIVVEGGSTDGLSREIAANLQRERTTVLFQDRPTRVGANRNLGIAHARGKYVCCLDADDLLRPTYVEKAVFLLERYGYDVVSCALEFFGLRTGVVSILERPTLRTILQANHVLTAAMFRRSFWVAAGGFRDATQQSHIHEDWLFWVRLGAYGARFFNMTLDPLLHYRVHGVSLSRGRSVAPMAEQARVIFELNSDVIDEDALVRSDQLARESRRASLPVRPEAYRRPLPGPDRPTVLLAAPWLVLGGAERLLSAIVEHLVKQGWRVLVVTSIAAQAFQGDTTAWFQRHTDEIYHLPLFLPEDRWDDFLRHLVASRGVDVLWIVGSAFAYDRLPSLKAEFPHLKVTDLLFNTVGHTENNRRRRTLIDLNIVENREVLAWLLDRGESPKRVQLLTSGVDIQALKPLDERPARAMLALGANELMVGFSGRWSEEKNPLAFIEIARRLDPTLPVRFVMTGAGIMEDAVKEALAAANLPEDRFHLAGEVDDIRVWLGSYDLLVLPSKVDGRPVVVLEALALGVPVLASRVGALPDLIQDGQTGWLCDSDDIDAFVRHIEDLVAAGPTARDFMRRNARAFAERQLDVRHMLSSYEAALTDLIRHPADRRDREAPPSHGAARATMMNVRPLPAGASRAPTADQQEP